MCKVVVAILWGLDRTVVGRWQVLRTETPPAQAGLRWQILLFNFAAIVRDLSLCLFAPFEAGLRGAWGVRGRVGPLVGDTLCSFWGSLSTFGPRTALSSRYVNYG